MDSKSDKIYCELQDATREWHDLSVQYAETPQLSRELDVLRGKVEGLRIAFSIIE